MKSKPSFPIIFYGTAWKAQKTAALVELALKTGFRAIDTACQPKHYNQRGVGIGIANSKIPREQIFIQTKFTPLNGQDPNNIPYNPKASLSEQVRQSFSVSQKNLQTEVIDSLVLHSPFNRLKQTEEVWRVFEELYQSGKVHYLGMSNCYNPSFFQEFYQKVKIKPHFLQNRFYNQTSYDKDLRLFCKKHGITYQSFWTLTANPHILASKQVTELSSKYKCTTAQIMYRVLISMQIIPLIGTTSQEHMKEDLAVREINLQEKEIDSVRALFGQK